MNQPIEGTAVVVPDAPASEPYRPIEVRSAFDVSPRDFTRALDRRKKNRKAFLEWVAAELKPGVDYGRIHVVKKDKCDKGQWCTNDYHFSKPSLWKPGAEKIAGMLGLRAHWPELETELVAVKGGQDLVGLRCELIDQGRNIVAEGIGTRSISQDAKDANKAFKMAKKSGLIDAVLNCGGLSEIFTLDLEDMDPKRLEQTGRDPFNPGEDRVDSIMPTGNRHPLETHCPIGRDWKGVPWDQVEDGFCHWIVANIDDKPDLVERAKKALYDRSVDNQEAVARRAEARKNPGKTMADYAREITAARSYDELVVIRDEIPEDLEPGLRKFISFRERELGDGPPANRA